MPVRPACESDFPAVRAIVNREIAEGTAHFGTTPMTDADLQRWLESRATLPWLVHEDHGGAVDGYAIASRWQQREGYDWTVTISVYVHPEAQGRGVGSRLYADLIPRLDDIGYRTIIAGIARDLAAEHGVPSDAVFAAGLSAGAAMAVILGETYPDVFSAIGVHSGLPYQSARDVQSAFSAMRGEPRYIDALPSTMNTTSQKLGT